MSEEEAALPHSLAAQGCTVDALLRGGTWPGSAERLTQVSAALLSGRPWSAWQNAEVMQRGFAASFRGCGTVRELTVAGSDAWTLGSFPGIRGTLGIWRVYRSFLSTLSFCRWGNRGPQEVTGGMRPELRV